MERLQSTTVTGVDITSSALLATYVATEDAEIYAQISLYNVAGGGTYKVCLTRQLQGAGDAYQSPTSAMALAAGTTNLYIGTIAIPVRENDVIKVYAEGLAGDNAVDGYVEIFDGAVSDELVDDIWDELLVGHTIAGSSGYTLSQTLSKILSTLSNLQQYSVLRKNIKLLFMVPE